MSIDRTPLRHTHLASLVLGAAALLAASGAHAQSAAVLDCSAGQTTASVTIATDQLAAEHRRGHELGRCRDRLERRLGRSADGLELDR